MAVTDQEVEAALDAYWRLIGVTVYSEQMRASGLQNMRLTLEAFEREQPSEAERLMMTRATPFPVPPKIFVVNNPD